MLLLCWYALIARRAGLVRRSVPRLPRHQKLQEMELVSSMSVAAHLHEIVILSFCWPPRSRRSHSLAR